jgi:PIN domain nuclease of toxin-antitoxin system
VSDWVFNASALLEFLLQEPGADRVAAIVAGRAAVMSAVNHSEVVARLADYGAPPGEITINLGRLPIEIVAFDETLSFIAGTLRPSTRSFGLSLGDRACLALARRSGTPAVTADRAWASLDVGIPIEVVR